MKNKNCCPIFNASLLHKRTCSRLIEHSFTSAPTQYRLYGRRVTCSSFWCKFFWASCCERHESCVPCGDCLLVITECEHELHFCLYSLRQLCVGIDGTEWNENVEAWNLRAEADVARTQRLSSHGSWHWCYQWNIHDGLLPSYVITTTK